MDELKSLAELKRNIESNNQDIHRTREWSNGDTLFGVYSYNVGRSPKYRTKSGKTFTEDERNRAVKMFQDKSDMVRNKNLFDIILFKATIQNPKTEGGGGAYTYTDEETGEKVRDFDAEPRLKSADFQNVEILGRKVFNNANIVDEYTIENY